MPNASKIAIHWFRRDLRLDDNPSLNAALRSGYPVLCLFIFDTEILDPLPRDDARVTFIHDLLTGIDKTLKERGSGLLILNGKPVEVWRELFKDYDIAEIHTAEDYEPYAHKRDKAIRAMARGKNVAFHEHVDHVIFKPGSVLKDDGDPYVVYTPFRNKWMEYADEHTIPKPESLAEGKFHDAKQGMLSLEQIGFKRSKIEVPTFKPRYIDDYDEQRDDPAGQMTTNAGPHLRFGNLSIREAVEMGRKRNETYLGELIWREFFINILEQFPRVAKGNFREKYDAIEWRNNEDEFEKWCQGKTGYPMVDAGMRQLNETGYMHNRVRMIVASFLCKHLLIDWRWGEAYFAEKLLDFELASNNGNWQWAAGTGCDAAPYFRIFNPTSQFKKYDKDKSYVSKWIPEFDTADYPEPIVEHKMARERALDAYKAASS